MTGQRDLFDFPVGKYGAIYADPCWRFKRWSGTGTSAAKTPEQHYATMSLAELKLLPVREIAAPDCGLFLWTTPPMLVQGLELMAAWGFTYKSFAAWAKRSKTGRAWAFGTGYVFRSAMEPLLYGTIGRPRILSHSQRNLIEAPIRQHSRKPDQTYALIECLLRGPYCELFSRSSRNGWDSWGDQEGRWAA